MRKRSIALVILGMLWALGVVHVFGQANPGPTPQEDPTGNTGVLKPQVTTGGSYDARTGNGTRIVNDLHLPGALGDYGLDLTRYWNSLPPGDSPTTPAGMPFADFGVSGWSHSWAWNAEYAQEYPTELPSCDCNDHTWTTSITITFPDGRVSKYKITRSDSGPYAVPTEHLLGLPTVPAKQQTGRRPV